MLKVVAASSVLGTARAQAPAAGLKLEESDAQAMALGYKQDTAKVDSKKYPKHEPTQSCASCQLFQGKATD